MKSTGVSERFIYELQRYCANNHRIEKVVLFGSRARGDYHRTPDIDLATLLDEEEAKLRYKKIKNTYSHLLSSLSSTLEEELKEVK